MEEREANKVRDIARKLQRDRYEVFLDRPGFRKPDQIGRYIPDIVAVKGDETIIVEVKSAISLRKQSDKVEFLAEYARIKPHVRFDLVVTNPRRKIEIEFDEVENILLEHFVETTISDIDEIATHTSVEDVADVDIYNVAIKENRIIVKGEGVISVRYQYGSDSDVRDDVGLVGYTDFPFHFEIQIDRETNTTEVSWVEVNTQSWWE
ncbi:MAG: hypothetical protein IMY79_02930 [Chloroflexi bacterium]|nr:hypothetical protein [Chloroflexota bacterium]